jgi:hypothetical protein
MTRASVPLLFFAAIGLALVLEACGGDRPPAAGDGQISPSMPMPAAVGDGIAVGACTNEGQVVSCRAVYGQHDGIKDCFEGEQSCTAGTWTPCQGDAADGRGP